MRLVVFGTLQSMSADINYQLNSVHAKKYVVM